MSGVWEPRAVACRRLDMTGQALGARGKRGTWPRKTAPDGGFLYLVPQSEDEARAAGVDTWELSPGAGDDAERVEAQSSPKVEKAGPRIPPYVVVGEQVVFSLPSRGYVPLPWPKSEVERFCNCYSRDGEGLTINQMCLAFDQDRTTIIEIKTALGLTKDSLPFSWDRVREEDEDDLSQELVFKKAGRIKVKAQRAHWLETQRLADKARNIEEFARNVLERMVVPEPSPMPRWKKGKSFEGASMSVFSHATDLHYGQGGWKMYLGHESSREATAARLYSSTNKVIDRVMAHGIVDTAYLGVGGDWMHIDNHHGTTTKGTPQDTDGRFLQVYIEAADLARSQIEMWRRRVGRVVVLGVRGNHDYYSSAMMMHYLRGVYADAEDVEIGEYVLDRQFLKIGNTLVGVTHGDRMKPAKLRQLMFAEAPKAMQHDTRYRIWFSGHEHSMAADEDFGVLCVKYPSLAANNGWDKREGYSGNRMLLQAHVFHRDEGPIASTWAEPDPLE